jgi:hypothetical protein
MELTSAEYHRAAAARARRLRAEATTPWLKAHLDEAIARHEQIAEGIERASEPDMDAGSRRERTFAHSVEAPEGSRGFPKASSATSAGGLPGAGSRKTPPTQTSLARTCESPTPLLSLANHPRR